MIFFLFSEIFISQLDRLQFESKYKMNRQGWKDALYVDKSILNTTQQTRSGGGSKKRIIVPSETGLTVVIFHSSRHSQCFISQISKCDVSQLSGAISQYSHDRPIFLGSWAQAYLFFTWPGPDRDMAVKTIIIQTWVNTRNTADNDTRDRSSYSDMMNWVFWAATLPVWGLGYNLCLWHGGS